MNDKNFWEQEYSSSKDVPSSRTQLPSSVLKEYCESQALYGGGCFVDLGAGNLRNSIYLASLGLHGIAIEWVKEATDQGHTLAAITGLADNIRIYNQSLLEPVPLGTNGADLVIDIMALHLLNEAERKFVSSEVNRVLKPGGRYLLFTIGAEGSEYKKLIAESPGPEPGSYTFEHNGFTIIEKGFTEEEIAQLFSGFRLVGDLQKKTTVSHAFGGEYERVYYFAVLEKEG